MRDLRMFCKTAPAVAAAAEAPDALILKIAANTTTDGLGPAGASAATAPPLPPEPAPPLPSDILRTVSLTHYDGDRTQARILHRMTDGWGLAPLPDQSPEECQLEQRALMAEFPIILDRLVATMPASPGHLQKYMAALAHNLSKLEMETSRTTDT